MTFHMRAVRAVVLLSALVLFTIRRPATAFSSNQRVRVALSQLPLDGEKSETQCPVGSVSAERTHPLLDPHRTKISTLTASLVVAVTLGMAGLSVRADEIGVEVEAPTLFTGETVMICKKRGLLGACLEEVQRTPQNDNDKANKYFQGQTVLIRQKEEIMRSSEASTIEGNALIDRLRRQSEENREQNDLYVQRKTFENDQSAIFGPFSRQVVIMNTDGKTFTLLQSPQAMRLKSSGFIDDRRKFIKQPTDAELQAALQSDGDGLFKGIQQIFGVE